MKQIHEKFLEGLNNNNQIVHIKRKPHLFEIIVVARHGKRRRFLERTLPCK